MNFSEKSNIANTTQRVDLNVNKYVILNIIINIFPYKSDKFFYMVSGFGSAYQINEDLEAEL